MAFPDTEKALMEVVEASTEYEAFIHLPDDFRELASKKPIVLVDRVGTIPTSSDYIRKDRVNIFTYSESRDKARDASMEIEEAFRGFHVTSHGTIDSVVVINTPGNAPMTDGDGLIIYGSSYQVDSRY